MSRSFATRRAVLAAALAAAPWRAIADVPEAATLLAPGPEQGPAAGFARRAAIGLPRGLAQAPALRVNVLGGPDGITAANRFGASTPADGRLLLALPGAAAQALLIGDSRARFEPRHWPALAAGLGPALLAGRGAAAGRAPLRLALPGPAAAEAAGLLALDMMGRAATPVFLAGGMTAEAAVAAGAAEALVLHGPMALARAAALGLTPWFAFDGPLGQRDPALPNVPALAEMLPDPGGPELVAALRAAGAALRVRAALVLPALTSADTVALWRAAARQWTEAEPAGAEAETRQVAAEEAARVMAILCPGPEATAAYRDWLLRRLAWRAS